MRSINQPRSEEWEGGTRKFGASKGISRERWEANGANRFLCMRPTYASCRRMRNAGNSNNKIPRVVWTKVTVSVKKERAKHKQEESGKRKTRSKDENARIMRCTMGKGRR